MPIHPKESCEARAEIGLTTPSVAASFTDHPPAPARPHPAPSRQLVEAKLPANPSYSNRIVTAFAYAVMAFAVVYFAGQFLRLAFA